MSLVHAHSSFLSFFWHKPNYHCSISVLPSNLLSNCDSHSQSAVIKSSSFSFCILNGDFFADIKYHINAAATWSYLEHHWKQQLCKVTKSSLISVHSVNKTPPINNADCPSWYNLNRCWLLFKESCHWSFTYHFQSCVIVSQCPWYGFQWILENLLHIQFTGTSNKDYVFMYLLVRFEKYFLGWLCSFIYLFFILWKSLYVFSFILVIGPPSWRGHVLPLTG